MQAVSAGYCLHLYLVEKVCKLGIVPVPNRPVSQGNGNMEMLIINLDGRVMVEENGNKH